MKKIIHLKKTQKNNWLDLSNLLLGSWDHDNYIKNKSNKITKSNYKITQKINRVNLPYLRPILWDRDNP